MKKGTQTLSAFIASNKATALSKNSMNQITGGTSTVDGGGGDDGRIIAGGGGDDGKVVGGGGDDGRTITRG